MSAPYPDISTVNMTADPTNILIYANTLTDGWFGVGMLFAFYIIVFIGSLFMQYRFSNQMKVPESFAVAGFVSVGFAAIMSMKTGLLNPMFVIIMIILSVLGVMWLAFSSRN